MDRTRTIAGILLGVMLATSIAYGAAQPSYAMGPQNQDAQTVQDEHAVIGIVAPAKPAAVKLIGDGMPLKCDNSTDSISIQVPAARRTQLVDVVQILDVPGDVTRGQILH